LYRSCIGPNRNDSRFGWDNKMSLAIFVLLYMWLLAYERFQCKGNPVPFWGKNFWNAFKEYLNITVHSSNRIKTPNNAMRILFPINNIVVFVGLATKAQKEKGWLLMRFWRTFPKNAGSISMTGFELLNSIDNESFHEVIRIIKEQYKCHRNWCWKKCNQFRAAAGPIM